MVKSLSVVKKFVVLLVVFILGMASLYGVSTYTINKTSIGSAAYNEIIDSKDLLADILPPPLYVVQTYLEASGMLRATDAAAIDASIAAITAQRADFEKRHDFWKNKLENSEIKNILLNEVYPLGVNIFEAIDTKLVPAAKAMDKGKMEDAFANAVSPEYIKHRQAVDRLALLLNDFATQAGDHGQQAVDQGALYFKVFFGLGLLIVVLLSFIISQDITSALNKCGSFARNIAAGKLDTELNLNRKDDFGELGQSLSHMLTELKRKIALSEEKTSLAEQETLKANAAVLEAEQATERAKTSKAEGMLLAAQQLEGVVEVVTSASGELAGQINQSSQGAVEQSKRASETASAMKEMNAAVLEISQNASEASDTANKAKLEAQNGSQVVNQAIKGIGDVQASSFALKADMLLLGKQADEIGLVLNVISDIADQTNLLALNAAIEAARAGDAGRGFAVVADEVRKLAEKTMTATKEVGEAIHNIQEGAKKNIHNVEQAVTTIDDATKLASKSGESLSEIVTLVDLTTDQVRLIATASEEQSAASEEINRSIEDVDRISSETSETMRHSSQSVGELARQALVLKDLIAHMKGDQ